MATIHLSTVGKQYEREQWALRGIDLHIEQGEFLALLGPSGCGKTTLLRLLAGFEAPTEGEIFFAGERVASSAGSVPPERRNVGVVFQSFALWPHMNVAENVAYSLRARGRVGTQSAHRIPAVADALERMGLQRYAERYPETLSGGQRQRVALARCLVQRPRLALLDEPLASLDVHLREDMMELIREFHQALDGALVYVTHDQSEAMALADRIAVLTEGRLLQIDTPHRLYREPRSETVARFLGRGRVLDVELVAAAGTGRFSARCAGEVFSVRTEADAALGPARALVRAGDVRLEDIGTVNAKVIRQRYLGGKYELELELFHAPGSSLVCEHGSSLPLGHDVVLSIKDGWIVPESV
ncbi:ABC transporter ATP-binding protein [Acidihalobacter ferrooxydans]|uniref:ABC transporter domain-containing protein n=1 Tax=Acidihalobacter ferrooxydans TaxID=1765967 RepID=A0A1P8UGT2_9GAMM|nr:ABC transporter ATP-binding protein [Acidihalobacter ferrooxydans]APZ43048.1 hypothetical protein BW247_08035 [Acidihalobacter ferrooxydans]